MPGRLITSYIANVREIQKEPFYKDAIKLYIARGTSVLGSLRNLGFRQVLELAPSESLLWDYKSHRITWGQYIMRFQTQMLRPETKKILDLIEIRLNDGFDLIMICFEKNHQQCHRSLIAEYIANKGFDCLEYGRQDN